MLWKNGTVADAVATEKARQKDLKAVEAKGVADLLSSSVCAWLPRRRKNLQHHAGRQWGLYVRPSWSRTEAEAAAGPFCAKFAAVLQWQIITIVNDYCSGFERRLMGGTSRLRIDKRSEVFLTGAVLFIFTGAS